MFPISTTIMDHEFEVKHFQFKFLPKINVSKQTDIERGQLLSSTKLGHIIVSQNEGKFYSFRLLFHVLSCLFV